MVRNDIKLSMKALIKKKPINPPEWYKGLEIADMPEPEVSAERPVKLKIVSSGICGTDVGIYQGKDSLAIAMSRLKQDKVILGHEFCGRVQEIHKSAREQVAQMIIRRDNRSSKVKSYLEGKSVEDLTRDKKFVEFLRDNFYVTAEMHFTCGNCIQCRIGDEHVCKGTIGKGILEDGSYTEYMVAPANRLVFIEEGEIAPEIISFMDAIGNGVHTAQSADLVGKTLLITGAGVQGLCSLAIARMMGANKIFITDAVRQGGVDKLSIAKKLGADGVFDAGTDEGRASLAETIAHETDNTGVDIVFEMSGNYKAYEQALKSVRMGGTLLLLGLPAGKMEIDFSTDVIFKGLTIKGIYGRRVFDTWDLMRYLLSRGLDKKILESGVITHQLPLADYKKGFEALCNGEAIKVILKP